MQVANNNSLFHTQATAATGKIKSGNDLPQASNNEAQATKAIERPSWQELMKTIDPTNMSRNESIKLADALMRDGQGDISSVFLTQGMVLNRQGGEYQSAKKDDPIMNEKFNMFDALQSRIDFNRSQGEDSPHIQSALAFLDKMGVDADTPEINTYA